MVHVLVSHPYFQRAEMLWWRISAAVLKLGASSLMVLLARCSIPTSQRLTLPQLPTWLHGWAESLTEAG